jgi:Fe-S oxidoreductase
LYQWYLEKVHVEFCGVKMNSKNGSIGEELRKRLPNVMFLDSIEDIYVYSRYGMFGTKKLENVKGVLRPSEPLDKEVVEELEEKLHITLLNNRMQENWEKNSSSQIVIVDERRAVDLPTLTERIKNEEDETEARKLVLRQTQPFPLWMLKKIQSYPAYSLNRTQSDNGYCVVQKEFKDVETYSSKGRLLLCKGLLNGELEPTDKLIDSMYNCTACGQCYDEVGGEGLEVNNAIIKARYEAVKTRGCESNLRVPIDNIISTKNPMGLSPEDRPIWYEEVAEEHPYKGNDILFWTGCTTSYRLPETVEATANVLRELEVDFGVLGEEESCCGLLMYLVGCWDTATRYAETLVEEFKGSGVKTILTGCAGCYYAFKKMYKTLGVETPFKVLHTTQIINQNIIEGKLTLNSLKGRYSWHDPCDLGRHSGVYEEPRNLLNSIPSLKLVEPPLTRQHTHCCGAGGGLMSYNYDLSESIATTKVIEHILPLDLDGVITGCPACVINLKNALMKEKMPVYDISEIVAMCL